MPYATPVDHQDPDIPPQIKLRRHQRSCSAKATFMDERGPGAFARFLNFLVTNRNHLAPSSTSARMTILSNGKPLKHSLMSSHSSPHVPGVCLHQHAQTEPAMPAGGPVKNVHFASDESLRTVRVFNASGKPINGSKLQAADENVRVIFLIVFWSVLLVFKVASHTASCSSLLITQLL